MLKEHIEIFGGGKCYIIHDFSIAELYQNGTKRSFKNPGKGHRQEVELFLKSIREGMPSPLPLDSILYTTVTTFRIIDALQSGLSQRVTIP